MRSFRSVLVSFKREYRKSSRSLRGQIIVAPKNKQLVKKSEKKWRKSNEIRACPPSVPEQSTLTENRIINTTMYVWSVTRSRVFIQFNMTTRRRFI